MYGQQNIKKSHQQFRRHNQSI